MAELNRWQKELQELNSRDYVAATNDVQKMYDDSLSAMLDHLQLWSENYPKMSFSEKTEFERQLQIAHQLSDIVAELGDNSEANIKDFLQNAGENAYSGVYYSIEATNSIVIPDVFINSDFITKLIASPVAGKTLSSRIHKDTGKLAKRATQAIRDGLWRGDSYEKIAARLKDMHRMSYDNALRIIRTENHRIQALATQKGYGDAVDKGIKLKKKWVASLDGRTRHDHRQLDNKIVGIDEKFKVGSYETMAPGLFGVASEDINCRCTTIEVIEGLDSKSDRRASDGSKWDKETYEKWKNEKQNDDVKFTDKQRSVINRYISGESYALNDKLRRNLKLTDSEREWVEGLDEALDNLPTYHGSVSRSLDFDDDQLREFISKVHVGGWFSDSAYQSFTNSSKPYNGNGRILIKIKDSKTGIDLRKINKAEQEILFKRNTKFKITNLYTDNGVGVMEVIEVD